MLKIGYPISPRAICDTKAHKYPHLVHMMLPVRLHNFMFSPLGSFVKQKKKVSVKMNAIPPPPPQSPKTGSHK